MLQVQFIFRLAWTFVIAVSVFDAYLVLQLRDVIQDTERNPLGRVLIQAANGSVWLFLLVKLSGTVVACMTLLVIFRSNRRLGLIIALAVALFQLGLLFYLRFV